MNNQVTFCPVCKGWDTEDQGITEKSKLCSNCGGESVQREVDDLMLFWDLPSQFNFAARRRADLFKKVFAGVLIGMIFILLASIVIGANSLSSLL